MARTATTADAFNAVAEPRRRAIIGLLARGERTVGELVDLLELGQPTVSKHLQVLRIVGIVRSRDDGRHRLYSLDGAALKPISEWIGQVEQTWSERFDRLDGVLAELEEGERG